MPIPAEDLSRAAPQRANGVRSNRKSSRRGPRECQPTHDALELLETVAADGAQVMSGRQDFARSKGTSPIAHCDLVAIVRDTVELARPRWQTEPHRRGVTIQVQVEVDGLPPILGNPSGLREALTDLIFNAVDAMPLGGRITFRGTATQDAVALTVADTGIGMPPDIQPKIFEPSVTTTGVKGGGLGLSVVSGIVERHGGRIAVTSVPMQGTTFTLTLQRMAEHPPTCRRSARPCATADESAGTGGYSRAHERLAPGRTRGGQLDSPPF